MKEAENSTKWWSREEDKIFERALVLYPEGTSRRWEKIAAAVPGRTLLEIENHYEDLLRDLNDIHDGLVDLPNYDDYSDYSADFDNRGGAGKRDTAERRKGVPWTAEEHRLFLMGLEKYGKGDWRSISRNAVVSRTPTQVASHAQKYFLRLNSTKKDKKRSSIHDITTVDKDASGQQSNDQNWIDQPGDGTSVGYEDNGFGYQM